MDEAILNTDPRTQLPRLANFEMVNGLVGTNVRVVGKILSNDGSSLLIQTTDGAKINCLIKQPMPQQLSQVVEITAMVARDQRKNGAPVYLEQYGQIHNWDDVINMDHLNEAIRLSVQPRFAKYFRCAPEGAITSSHQSF